MRLHIIYLTKNNSFNSIEVICNYRKEAITKASARYDYKSLYRVIRLRDKPFKAPYNGCKDDHLTRWKGWLKLFYLML